MTAVTHRISVTTAVLLAALASAVAFALGRVTSSEPAHADSRIVQQEPMPMPMEGVNDMQENDLPAAGEATIAWTAPPRWMSVPNPSSMRLATFKIPRVSGDEGDPELSVTQVGGDVDSNIDRWIGQFDEAAQKTAQRSTKTVRGMKVTFVEIEGAFSGGMGPSKGVQKGWALLGAIVETSPMPHFFKLTGPAKSVKAARAELEGMIDTITPRM